MNGDAPSCAEHHRASNEPVGEQDQKPAAADLSRFHLEDEPLLGFTLALTTQKRGSRLIFNFHEQQW
jgi:hypothetical protein